MLLGEFSTEHAGSATVTGASVLFVTLCICISRIIYLLKNLSLLRYDTQLLGK